MKNLCSTKGIVISKIKFKETSYILKVFSKNYGYISVIVHGARKHNSKFLGFFNILNELNFDLIKSKNSEIYVLRDAEFIRFFLLGMPYKIQPYYYIVGELIQKIYSDGYNNIYDLIIFYYEKLSEQNQKNIFIFWRFLNRLLSLLGYPIIISNCVNCGKEITENIYFSPSKGGFLCKNCSIKTNNKIKLTEEVNLIFSNFKNIGNLDKEITENTINEINKIFITHLKNHTYSDFNLKLIDDLI